MNTELAMARYQKIYLSLYKRTPSELRDLGGDWVLVNGARMTIEELKQLTEQLQNELQQEQARKKNLLSRLVGFFNRA